MIRLEKIDSVYMSFGNYILLCNGIYIYSLFASNNLS